MKLLMLVLFLQYVCSSVGHVNLNVTRYETSVVETEYLNWVNHIGTRYDKHTWKSQKQKTKKKLKPCKTIKVSKNPKKSKKHFPTVQDAINSLPVNNWCRVVISIGRGTYREKVEIPVTMAYITLKGKGADDTVIEWDDTADKSSDGGQPLGTYASATFAVNSPYFIAKNLTFKNAAPLPPSGALGKQAVALRITADKAAFIGCKFIGAQDTLYDHKGRHYFKECYIEGSVDFVFGNGLSLYDRCHLHAISNGYGALTAQKRGSVLEETGFSFVNCKITGSGALYLGRAWGTFSRVVYAYTYMDKIITPGGWYDWGDKSRDMYCPERHKKFMSLVVDLDRPLFITVFDTKSAVLNPRTVFYGQFKCSGPGADDGKRVSWSRELTQQEAQPFMSLDFIDGHKWLKN